MKFKTKSHELKSLPKYFCDVKWGVKKFELRMNDRDYEVGCKEEDTAKEKPPHKAGVYKYRAY